MQAGFLGRCRGGVLLVVVLVILMIKLHRLLGHPLDHASPLLTHVLVEVGPLDVSFNNNIPKHEEIEKEHDECHKDNVQVIAVHQLPFDKNAYTVKNNRMMS